MKPFCLTLLAALCVAPHHAHGMDKGITHLMMAAAYGHPRAVQILLATSQTNPNGRDRAGTTALMLAAEAGHPECVRILLSASDIDINIQDIACDTALDRARTRFKQTKEPNIQMCITLIEGYQYRRRQRSISRIIARYKGLIELISPTPYRDATAKEKAD